jgi:hypothetical protein
MIAQLKHQSSSFKQYLLHERVHINNAQLDPKEGILMGWITGSHPAFTHRGGVREELSTMMVKCIGTQMGPLPKNNILYEEVVQR